MYVPPRPLNGPKLKWADDRHAHLLSPAFALSGLISEAPNYKQLSVEEIDALLLEMEPDIRAADRDLQEINELEKKGVTGPGKLPGSLFLFIDFLILIQCLGRLRSAGSSPHKGRRCAPRRHADGRVSGTTDINANATALNLCRYFIAACVTLSDTLQVDTLSELFVAWDDTLTEAEEKVTIIERDKAEKARLGLE